MYFRTQGVILSRKNFGEADRILKIYTKDYGKVSALAKGVRRPRSKKGGHLEIGNWCKVFIAKGKNLDILTEVELKKAFGIEDFQSEKTNKIYHILELVDSLTQENHKNEELFILLIQYLAKIETEKEFDFVSSGIKVKLLTLLGFFSAKNLKESNSKKVLTALEEEEYLDLKQKLKFSQEGYLKLLGFLDSMIENITESKLKTKRFLQ